MKFKQVVICHFFLELVSDVFQRSMTRICLIKRINVSRSEGEASPAISRSRNFAHSVAEEWTQINTRQPFEIKKKKAPAPKWMLEMNVTLTSWLFLNWRDCEDRAVITRKHSESVESFQRYYASAELPATAATAAGEGAISFGLCGVGIKPSSNRSQRAKKGVEMIHFRPLSGVSDNQSACCFVDFLGRGLCCKWYQSLWSLVFAGLTGWASQLQGAERPWCPDMSKLNNTMPAAAVLTSYGENITCFACGLIRHPQLGGRRGEYIKDRGCEELRVSIRCQVMI